MLKNNADIRQSLRGMCDGEHLSDRSGGLLDVIAVATVVHSTDYMKSTDFWSAMATRGQQ